MATEETMDKFDSVIAVIGESVLQQTVILSETLKLNGSISKSMDRLNKSTDRFADFMSTILPDEEERFNSSDEKLTDIDDKLDSLNKKSENQEKLLKKQTDLLEKDLAKRNRDDLLDSVDNSTPGEKQKHGLGGIPGIHPLEDKKKTEGILGSLLGTFFGSGFGTILGGSIVGAATSLGSTALKGGLVALAIPYIHSFVTNLTESVLEEVDWDNDVERIIGESSGNIGVGAMIGAVLSKNKFKGALIGALGGGIKTMLDKSIESLDKEDMEVNFAGMTFDSGKITSMVSVAAASAIALMSPAMVSTIVSGLVPILMGPAGWLAGAAAIIGGGLVLFNKHVSKKRDELISNTQDILNGMSAEQLQSDLSSTNSDSSWWKNLGLNFGLRSDVDSADDIMIAMKDLAAKVRREKGSGRNGKNTDALAGAGEVERQSIKDTVDHIVSSVDLEKIDPEYIKDLLDITNLIGYDNHRKALEEALERATENLEISRDNLSALEAGRLRMQDEIDRNTPIIGPILPNPVAPKIPKNSISDIIVPESSSDPMVEEIRQKINPIQSNEPRVEIIAESKRSGSVREATTTAVNQTKINNNTVINNTNITGGTNIKSTTVSRRTGRKNSARSIVETIGH